MKNKIKIFGAMPRIAIIALAVVIGFSLTGCAFLNALLEDTEPAQPSLNGVWKSAGSGLEVTFSGNTGIYKSLNATSALHLDAINKGYIKPGDQAWKNIQSTGNLTWAGQVIFFIWSGTTTNCTGVDFGNGTFTMSADGQTVTLAYTSPAMMVGTTGTWTRQ